MIILPNNNRKLEGNDLKTQIQCDVVDNLAKYQWLVLEALTGFGKTNTGLVAIDRIRKKNPEPIYIVVPTTKLKNDWLTHTSQYENIEVIVINTLTIVRNDEKKIVKKGILVIFDECHRVLNEESEYFSNALDLIDCKYKLLLSATLEKKHKEFLLTKGIEHYFKISLYWANKNNLVPNHYLVNVPVTLTRDEKISYVNANSEISKYARIFAPLKIYHPYSNTWGRTVKEIAKELDFTDGQVFGCIGKWTQAIAKRKDILYNAQNKYVELENLLAKIGDEKVLIFCKLTKSLDRIVEINDKAIGYHGKLTAKNKLKTLEAFDTGYKPYLVSIEMLKEGFNIKDCSYAINFSYTSKSLDSTQKLGRILRLDENNPDKKAIFFNLVVKSFILGEEFYDSQEEKWLKKSQENQIVYNIEDIQI